MIVFIEKKLISTIASHETNRVAIKTSFSTFLKRDCDSSYWNSWIKVTHWVSCLISTNNIRSLLTGHTWYCGFPKFTQINCKPIFHTFIPLPMTHSFKHVCKIWISTYWSLINVRYYINLMYLVIFPFFD